MSTGKVAVRSNFFSLHLRTRSASESTCGWAGDRSNLRGARTVSAGRGGSAPAAGAQKKPSPGREGGGPFMTKSRRGMRPAVSLFLGSLLLFIGFLVGGVL